MTKYIVKVSVEGNMINVFDQTASDVAIWILQDKAFSSVVKQSRYYAVKNDERIKGQEAKAIVFAEKVGA